MRLYRDIEFRASKIKDTFWVVENPKWLAASIFRASSCGGTSF